MEMKYRITLTLGIAENLENQIDRIIINSAILLEKKKKKQISVIK